MTVLLILRTHYKILKDQEFNHVFFFFEFKNLIKKKNQITLLN